MLRYPSKERKIGQQDSFFSKYVGEKTLIDAIFVPHTVIAFYTLKMKLQHECECHFVIACQIRNQSYRKRHR